MPGQDGTGPAGQGPGTGKGRGPCLKGKKRNTRFGQDASKGRFAQKNKIERNRQNY